MVQGQGVIKTGKYKPRIHNLTTEHSIAINE